MGPCLKVKTARCIAQPALVAHGCCYFCDEVLAPAMLFCGVDCRDDYDKEPAAKARAGRTRMIATPRDPSRARLAQSMHQPPMRRLFRVRMNDVISEARKTAISARCAQLSPPHACPLYRTLLLKLAPWPKAREDRCGGTKRGRAI